MTLSISLRNSDGSIDNKTGIKISFGFTPERSFEAVSPGMWKYTTSNGYASNIKIHQNYGFTFKVTIRAPGYADAISSSFTKNSYDSWHVTASASPTSVCPYEEFILNSCFIKADNSTAKPFPLLIDELGDSLTNGAISLTSTTGVDSNTIAIKSAGIKHIYAVYDNNNAFPVEITAFYCSADVVNSFLNVKNI